MYRWKYTELWKEIQADNRSQGSVVFPNIVRPTELLGDIVGL